MSAAKTKRRPFQVYLDEDDIAALEQAAKLTGVTKSDLARKAIRRAAIDHLHREDDPLWGLLDLVTEEEAARMPADLAEHHDAYLAQWQMEDDGTLPKSAPPHAERRR